LCWGLWAEIPKGRLKTKPSKGIHMKKIVLTIAAAAILAACATHHSNGGNELYGEIKGGVESSHVH